MRLNGTTEPMRLKVYLYRIGAVLRKLHVTICRRLGIKTLPSRTVCIPVKRHDVIGDNKLRGQLVQFDVRRWKDIGVSAGELNIIVPSPFDRMDVGVRIGPYDLLAVVLG